MVEENTIILCVVPANQDITNDEVLHMARQIDVKGERTIGCVTKIDIMDRGTDARALLMNKGEVPLKLGFVGIKNRSQADINENKTVIFLMIDLGQTIFGGGEDVLFQESNILFIAKRMLRNDFFG